MSLPLQNSRSLDDRAAELRRKNLELLRQVDEHKATIERLMRQRGIQPPTYHNIAIPGSTTPLRVRMGANRAQAGRTEFFNHEVDPSMKRDAGVDYVYNTRSKGVGDVNTDGTVMRAWNTRAVVKIRDGKHPITRVPWTPAHMALLPKDGGGKGKRAKRRQQHKGGNPNNASTVFDGPRKCNADSWEDAREDCGQVANFRQLLARGKLVGKGDVGAAYMVKDPTIGAGQTDIVLKEVQLHADSKEAARQRQQLKDEVCIGKVMGDAGIAPEVYDQAPWYCDGRGYYRMEKMAGTWAELLPTSEELALKAGKPRLTLAQAASKEFKDMECQLVAVLENMVRLGVVHNDNHPGNVGLIQDTNSNGKDVKYRTVLFDFGFALPKNIPQTVASQILMSHLYIVLEHYDHELFAQSYLLDVIYDIRQNNFVWGAHDKYLKQYFKLPQPKQRRGLRK